MKASTILSSLMLIVGGTAAAAQTRATVTGTLAIAGKTYRVAHVRAQVRKDPFDDTKKQVRLMLSDVAVSDSALHSEDAYLDLVNDDKLHAIVFWFAADGTPAGGEIQHDMTGHQFLGDDVKFTKKAFDLSAVAGTISIQSMRTASFSFNCTATFTARVER
jgi:hypothetical protein